jgi:serine phosphatase RsbU (regulator of sigma subunit)/sensor domain CHASE-containing protein
MGLRVKTLIIVALTLIGLVALLYTASTTILLTSFEELETTDNLNNLARATNAMRVTQDKLDASVIDYGQWDDTYNYLANRNESYLTTNWTPDVFDNFRLVYGVLLDKEGKVVAERGYDFTQKKMVTPSADIRQAIMNTPQLLQYKDATSRASGFLLVPGESPLYASGIGVTNGDRSGEIRGMMIWVRPFDDTEVKILAETTRLNLEIYRSNGSLPSDVANVIRITPQLNRQKRELSNPLSPTRIAAYRLMDTFDRGESLIVRIETERAVYAQGQRSLQYLVIALTIAGIAFGVAIILLLERFVLSRLAKVSKGVAHVGQSGNLSERLNVPGNDELGKLSTSINTMLADLEAAQNKVREAEQAEQQRIKEELETARKVQISMLPKDLPDLIYAELAGYSSPAYEASGDLYDVIPLDRDEEGRLLRVGIVVCDVMGKGIASALVMASTRAAFRAEAMRYDSPAEVLRRVNQSLVESVPRDLYVTALYGVYEIESQQFRFSTAGHPYPFHSDQNGVRELENSGRPLGLKMDSKYKEEQLILHPGSVVWMFTDGLAESYNMQREMVGFDGLMTQIQNTEHTSTNAQVLLDSILSYVKNFRGNAKQEDDVTVVVLRVKSTGIG